jgi:D-sedoheptulose 7-phosphate isomerase
MKAKRRIDKYLKKSVKTYEGMLRSCVDSIEQAAALLVETYYKKGGTVFTFGNGGSAADAQHLADELMCMLRYDHNFKYRFPLSAHALTADSSVMTAIGNDLGFDYIFSRQLEALAQADDLVIGLSTSGNSKNVVLALDLAKNRGISSIGLTGRDGGIIVKKKLADVIIRVPADDVGMIQQGHVLAFHSMCDVMEEILFSEKGLEFSRKKK